jgi:eukaryotic-like serine/threonine-protein kinase
LYDAGVDAKGRPYLALEYIDGQPLDDWCEAKGLSIGDRLRLFVQVARAVAYAHGRLVVHRDLKPSNVLVTADGQAHLLDFGIAKLLHEAGPGEDRLTQEQGRVLTPHYASPEQIRGETITVASDVYSLGVLLYELLTGRYPYEPESRSLAAIEAAILNDEPILASSKAKDKSTAKALRGEIDAILGKALRREPNQRYATVDAFAEDVERHLIGDVVLARPDSSWYRIRKTIAKHRFGVAATAATLAATLTVAGIWVAKTQEGTRAAERQRLMTDFVGDVFRINFRPGGQASPVPGLYGDRLLQEGSKLIENRFPGQPELQADLYGIVGQMFLDMGASDEAVAYRTRQLEALGQARASSSVRAAALTSLARSLSARGRHAEAAARAREAIEMLRNDAHSQAEAMAVLVTSLMYLGRNTEALEEISLLDTATKEFKGETTAAAVMYGMKGSVYSALNRYPEAGPLYERGIAIALRVEGEFSSTAIELRILQAAQIMMNGDDPKKSQALTRSVVHALESRGGPSSIAAAKYAAFFARRLALAGAISYEDAKSEIERRQLFLANQPSAPDYIRKRVDFERGPLELVRGNVEEADRWISPNLQAALKSTDQPYLQMEFVPWMASLKEYQGDYDAGNYWRDEMTRLRKSVIGGAEHPYAAFDYTNRSRNLSRAGRFLEAKRELDRAPALTGLSSKNAFATATSNVFRNARLEILVNAEDFEAAWMLARDFELSSPGSDSWRYQIVGVLQCERGHPKEGRKLLESVLSSDAFKDEYEYSPDLAMWRAQTGWCAFVAGDTKAARSYAKLAREAFTAQPNVSFYFKRPLVRLELALK